MESEIWRAYRKDLLAIFCLLLLFTGLCVIDSNASDFLYLNDAGTTEPDFYTQATFSIDHYRAPWRYRLAPRIIQWWLFKSISRISSVSFATIATTTSYFFLAAALTEFYCLIRVLGLSVPWAISGWLFANTSFPVIFGFREFNYMTLDDTLSYALLLAGLLAIIARRYIYFVGFSILAALTRETTLILALMPMFDGNLKKVQKIIFALPALTAAGIVRFLQWQGTDMTAQDMYQHLVGNVDESAASGVPIPHLLTNLLEEGVPLTSVYVFATFGAIWIIAFLGWIHVRRISQEINRPFSIISTSAPTVLGLLVTFNLLFAYIRENRILFLAFPWVLSLAIIYLSRVPSSSFSARHLRAILVMTMIVALPIFVFLLAVPGGEGDRLAYLRATPGGSFLFYNIWMAFLDRFDIITGQKMHVLINLTLGMLVVMWRAVDRRLREHITTSQVRTH